jgi:hypothetical protein
MAVLKFRDKDGAWQYAPSLKFKDENGVWKNSPCLKYKDENGVWHKVSVCKPSPTLNTLDIGSSVYLNENGSPAEYMIVQKGIPSATLYDSSCDGVWMMRKDLCEKRAWNDEAVNNYNESSIHEYLNGTFFNSLDNNVRSLIKTVKIPYGIGGTSTVKSGANGVSTKIFLPSAVEVGLYSPSEYPVDGACWSYFNGASNSLRVARLNGTIEYWWLRSPDVSTNGVWAIMGTGNTKYSYAAVATYAVRPVLILPFNAEVDTKTNMIV